MSETQKDHVIPLAPQDKKKLEALLKQVYGKPLFAEKVERASLVVSRLRLTTS